MSDQPGQTSGTTGAPPGPEPGYQPQPPATYSGGGSGPSGPRAGFWVRFAALLLDSILLGVLLGVLLAVLDVGIAYVLFIVALFAYFIVLEGGASGQTLGMKALSIRVVDFDGGGPIGYGRATVRALVQYFLSGILYLGYLWMLWDKEKQTWHDKASRSVVVPLSAYPLQ
jgi:uncharacterized RDD family membrane protein YckC